MKPLAALMFATILALTGCGDSTDTGTISSSPTPSPSDGSSTDAVVVDITVKDGTVTPQGDRVDATVGQQITLHIRSDADEEFHVHSEPEHEFEIDAGDDVEKSFTIETPGQVAVEAHHLEATVVQLVVRP